MVWNNFAFISLVCALLSVASALLSLSARRPGAPFLFGLMGLAIASWSFCLFLGLSSQDSDSALFWVRGANYVILFVPAILFHFVVSFVGKKEGLERTIFSYYLLSVLYFSMILASPESFLHSPSMRFDAFWFPLGGSLFYFFPLLFMALVGHSLYVLMLERENKDRTEKLKLDYLIITIALGFLGGGLSLSLEFNVNIPPYGILSVAFMVAISTYAVLKHDLLDLPETFSLIITRLMVYICIVGFTVLVLKGGVLMAPEYLSVSQISLIVLVTVLSCEFYAAMKSRLQVVTDNVLVRKKLDSEKQFRDLMYQLDSSDDFESMLPILRRFFEHQGFVHHYGWYMDTKLLERMINRRKHEARNLKQGEVENVYQRILFSSSEGRRHDRLPPSIRLAKRSSGAEELVKSQMVDLMSSEQLDIAYDWAEKVPGREMLGLPIVANGEFRGLMLVVVSRSDLRYTDQARMQSLSAKLGRLVERVEFFQQQRAQEQRFLYQQMQSLQSLAGNIAYEMQMPMEQLRQFVSDVALTENGVSASATHQARLAIERSAQVIDMSLGLVRDEPVDLSTFKTLSIQNVVTKALADYVFLPGERERIHCNLRHDFSFKGDETLLIYALFYLIKNALKSSGFGESREITIESEVKTGSNVLIFRENLGVRQTDLFNELECADGQWRDVNLGFSYCKRVMSVLGGSMTCSSESEDGTEFQLTFPYLGMKPLIGGLSLSEELDLSSQ